MKTRNYYFVKKFIFSIMFFITIGVFCIGDFIKFSHTFKQRGKKIAEIHSVDDLKKWISQTDSEITSSVMGRMRFIELYGYVQKLLGKREFNNFAYIKDDDGMMYYGSVAELETNDLEEYAGNVMRLNEYIESRGAHLLVVIPPTKVMHNVSEVKRDWPVNDPNNRTDRLLMMLQQRGVDTYDLRRHI